MAANKRKILEAARKYAQKGSKDRALKEYEKLLKLDPRDAKLRLEIGDAYRRWGQLEDAVGTYTKVAEQYMAEGFDARAVAVFKQIHNLDPERWSAYEPLAELYQRMGLAAEASTALQTAAEGYQRAGKRREALGLLRKMASIDPANTTSRLRVADLLRQEGLAEDAVAEYDGVAEEFERQGELEQAAAALGRLLEIQPDHVSALSRAVQALVQIGQPERAEPFARRLLDADSDVPEHYEMLADLYRRQGREDELGGVYRRLAELYRRRGDEDRAREITQRFVPSDGLSASDPGLEELPLAEEAVGMKGDLSQFLDDAESGSDTLLDEDLLDPEPPAETRDALALGEESVPQETPEPPPLPDGDPEQLLAEACVYLRYGKREQAIRNLEAIAAREPRHRGALEKLGEALAEGDRTDEAVQVWLRAAGIAQEEGDGEALDVLRDRIAALDQAAAATLGSVSSDASDGAELEDPEPEEEYLEISQPVAPAGPDVSLDDGTDDIEIEIDLDDEPELDSEAATHRPPATAQATPTQPSASSSTSQQVLDEIDEAEFYLQQGMLDEAQGIYERLRGIAPNHPKVLVRLGELAAARGDDPGATGSEGGAAPAPEDSDLAGSGSAPPDLEGIPDDLEWTDELSAAVPAPGQGAGPGGLELTGEITSELSDTGEMDPQAPDPGDTGTVMPVSEGASEESDAGSGFDLDLDEDDGTPSLEAAAAEPDAGFDLAAEIHSVLDEAGDSGSADGSTDGFAAVFREFKRGVSEQLAEGDHEAHYDLGIAYREMGLFDDAMTEFRAAMANPGRRLDCLHMLGQCAIELGDASQAVAHLELALATGTPSRDQQLPLYFDLGRAFEMLGDPQRARESWETVVGIEPSFADVEERLANLRGEKPDESEFESFDDVVEEAARDTAPASAGQGVDFDDLVEEMNAEPEPEPEPEPPRPRKRKKISFV